MQQAQQQYKGMQNMPKEVGKVTKYEVQKKEDPFMKPQQQQTNYKY